MYSENGNGALLQHDVGMGSLIQIAHVCIQKLVITLDEFIRALFHVLRGKLDGKITVLGVMPYFAQGIKD